MNVDYLLEQYFEGLTTADEEAMLRRFFTSGDVPGHLLLYKPLFEHFDSEIKQTGTDSRNRLMPYEINPLKTNRQGRPKTLILWISGIAASVAILTGAFFYASQHNRCPGTGDYVMIDGRCYTDAATIRSATLNTLHEVAKDGEFLPDDPSSNVMDMVGNQLKEFDFLLEN